MRDETSIRDELAALRASRDLLRDLNATGDLLHTSRAILEAACRVEGIDSGGIYLVDQGSGTVRLAAHHGLPREFVEQTSYYPADAPEAILVRAGQAVYLDHATLGADAQVPSGRLCLAAGLQALAVLPVALDGRVVAVLNLASHTHREIPLPARAALEVMTTPLGGAIARAQVDEALRHERDFAEGLIRTAQAIILVLDLDGRIVRFNPYLETLSGHRLVGVHGRDWCATFVPERERERVRAVIREALAGSPVSVCVNPILTREGQERQIEWHSTELRDAEGHPTGILAVGLDIAERLRVEAALRRRTRQLEAVRVLGTEITRELEFPALLALLIRQAMELLAATSGSVHLWDEAAQRLTPAAWEGDGEWLREYRPRLGEGAMGRVVRLRKGCIINNYRTSPHAHPTMLAHTSISAAIFEPLLYRDGLLGVIVLNHHGGVAGFTEEDQYALHLLVTQAAIAIENARAHERLRQRGQQLEALLQASRTVMAGLDLQTTLERIGAEASRIARCRQVKVVLVDREAGMLRLGAAFGHPAPAMFPAPVGSGLSGMVAQTGQPLFIADCQGDPRNSNAAFDRELGFCTYLGLPIKVRGVVRGVLTFNTTEPREYGTEELAYLTSFADQAAIALENVRLYDAAREELRQREEAEAGLRSRTAQLEALHTISEEITRELDLGTLLDLLIRRAVDLIATRSGMVFLWDEAGRRLVPAATLGIGDWFREIRFKLGEGVAGAVAERRVGMIVNDYRQSPYLVPSLVARVGSRCLLGEPLLYRGRLIGVILVRDKTNGEPFSVADQERLHLFAAPAAIAIEHARLFQEQQRAYDELRRAQEESVRTEKLRALGQMAAGIAHDLNNMLAAVLGQTELLRLRVDLPEVQEALQVLCTAASDGAQVVRRLTEFGRQQPSRAPVPCDLGCLVGESLELTRPRWQDEAQRRGHLIQVQTALDGLPRVQGDPAEIREALTNLVLNAVDAMPAGGNLTLAGSVEPEADAPEGVGWVVLSVRDTGVGMEDEVCRRVFDPFFTTKGLQGTGLGLAVVHGIMERHGGRIAVTSAPGEGTTFTLRFRPVPLRPPEAAGAGRPPAPPRLRILLIDDEANVRTTLAGLLRIAGHSVVEADGGAKGLALLAEHAPELVITDLGMPGMTGWEVAQKVKAAAPRTPVLLLTGWGQQVSGSLLGRGEVDRVLGKPIRLEELQAVITELHARSEGGKG